MLDYSLSDIRYLCGTTAYTRGKEYCDQGRVLSLVSVPSDDEFSSSLRYDAIVHGGKKYKVSIHIDDYGELETHCNCPAYGEYYYEGCKHIAAVLIALHRRAKEADKQERRLEKERFTEQSQSIWGPNSLLHQAGGGRPADVRATRSYGQQKTPDVSYAAAEQMMKLLGGINSTQVVEKSGESPESKGRSETLQVEYIVHVVSGTVGEDYLELELKLGVKRTYIVQKIRPFLDAVAQGESFPFTKLFTFDPSIQSFLPEDQSVLDLLLRIHRNERLMKKTMNPYGVTSRYEDSKHIYIPAIIWDQLLDKLLLTGHVSWEGKGTEGTDQIELAEGIPVVEYKVIPGQGDNYALKVDGLDRLALLESYGTILQGGRLYRLEPQHIRHLSAVKSTLSAHGAKQRIEVSASQIEPFLQYTLPVLKQVGQVKLDKNVQRRIQEPDLVIKAFLDQEGGGFALRLEFHYGDVILNPLLSSVTPRKDRDIIIIRDNEREQRILSLLGSAGLTVADAHWLAYTDEEVYELVYGVLPLLEEQAELYVTQAVQRFRQQSSKSMKLKAEMTKGLDWLELSFELEGIEHDEIYQLLKGIVEKKHYVRLRSGALLSLEGDSYNEIRAVAEQLELKRGSLKQGKLRVPGLHALQLFNPDEQRSKAVRLSKSLRQFLERLHHPERQTYEVPESLAPILRDYQVEGFQWFKNLSSFGFGGILADDMGLGKTLQTIAYIRSELTLPESSASPAAPVLIITPASLTYNWQNELSRFAPELRVAVVAGDKEYRGDLLEGTARGGYDVLITSYPLLRRDAQWYEDKSFPILILDEAQAIKNSGSQTAHLVKQLSARHRFALTGTPIENSIQELWSIFEAVFPALFHGQKQLQDLPRDRIARMISPFLLRRLKQDVLEELPDRIETVQRSALDKEQKKLYMAYMAQLRDDTLKDLETDGFQKSRMKILAGITRLRQLCCHPSLFIEGYAGNSGKLEQLLELVEDGLSSGRRFLIFSQFASMLSLLRNTLQQHGHQVFYLDGSTPAHERVEMSQRFNDGEHDIFLISLKAGGTGLNLTGADTVILYDLWWNPAVEEQAAGRAHRMGQRKVVQVFRMVAEGTIEEKMLEMQQKKKDLIEDVLDSSASKASALSEEDIRELLRM